MGRKVWKHKEDQKHRPDYLKFISHNESNSRRTWQLREKLLVKINWLEPEINAGYSLQTNINKRKMAAKLKYIRAKIEYKFKKKPVESFLLGSEETISSVKYDNIDRILLTADRATHLNMSLNLLTEQLTLNTCKYCEETYYSLSELAIHIKVAQHQRRVDSENI